MNRLAKKFVSVFAASALAVSLGIPAMAATNANTYTGETGMGAKQAAGSTVTYAQDTTNTNDDGTINTVGNPAAGTTGNGSITVNLPTGSAAVGQDFTYKDLPRLLGHRQ